jgi:hypothetical protein
MPPFFLHGVSEDYEAQKKKCFLPDLNMIKAEDSLSVGNSYLESQSSSLHIHYTAFISIGSIGEGYQNVRNETKNIVNRAIFIKKSHCISMLQYEIS